MDGIDGLPQRWETIVISSVKNPENKNIIGLSIEEIAKGERTKRKKRKYIFSLQN